MERTLKVTFISLLLTALFVLGIVSVTVPKEQPSEQAVSPPEDISVPEMKMRLGSYGGYLALYSGSGRYPTEIYPVLIRSLPEADRAKLTEGIELSGEAELREILEDYSS